MPTETMKALIFATLLVARGAGAHESCVMNVKRQSQEPAGEVEAEDPASAWVDPLPIRPNQAWDISTDFPYPRVAEFEVKTTTWSRLDVHPNGKEIVFDTVGELYCLPITGGRAKRILSGVPWDTDPRFSPDGTQLLYRSDAGLGTENAWLVPYTTCSAMDLDSGPFENPQAEADAKLLANGEKETSERRERRLKSEGRLNARPVTNETYRFVTHPEFNPFNPKQILATKWFTSTRSIGAGEIWSFDIPAEGAAISSNGGKRIAPRKETTSGRDYGSIQVGPEMGQWKSEDEIIYSQNMADVSGGQFTYNKNVHEGIYQTFIRNITSGTETQLPTVTNGGSSRPQLSHDRKTLAYVKRVESRSVLATYHFESGTTTHVWGELTPDQQALYAPAGTYPGFAFLPDDSAVVLWARGGFWIISLDPKVPVSERGKRIDFTAKIKVPLGEKRSQKIPLEFEERDTQKLTAFDQLAANDKGDRVVFNGGAQTFVFNLTAGDNSSKPELVPTLYGSKAPYFTPTIVPASNFMVVHARWSDTNMSSFELSDVTRNVAVEIKGLPRKGRYQNPVISSLVNGTRKIAFVRSSPTELTGAIEETLFAGIWVGDIVVPDGNLSATSEVSIVNPKLVSDREGNYRLEFTPDNTGLYLQGAFSNSILLNIAEGTTTPVESSRDGHEVVAGPPVDGRSHAWVAFVDYHQAYLAPAASNGTRDAPLWSKPGVTEGIIRLSVNSGHGLTFSKDGSKLFWLSGPTLYVLQLSKLSDCESQIKDDTSTFGLACVKDLPTEYKLDLNYKTLAAKNRAATGGSNKVYISNARIYTMESEDAEPLLGAAILAVDGRIEAVGYNIDVPKDAHRIDAKGAVITPGFIDSHAHWSSTGTLPARSWQLRTFLAFGVTTLHNPSSDNVAGYVERSLVEQGFMLGSRIYHTGNVLYGADGSNRVEINSLEDARQALRRIKVEGGAASFSAKNYNQPTRASRQRFLIAAKELGMLIVPEGGMNFDMDLTHVVDGTSTNEHNLPIEALYDDVIELFAKTGAAMSPTNIVSYAEKAGELYLWEHGDLFGDQKLLNFVDRASLEYSTFEYHGAPNISYSYQNVSRSNTKLWEAGVPVIPGAHGETPLGRAYHWELQTFVEGGLSNYDAIRAGTARAAQVLGLYDNLGSLTPGKLADFIVYQPGSSPLDNIVNTRKIEYVVRGGSVYKAETLEEVYPVAGRTWEGPQINIPYV